MRLEGRTAVITGAARGIGLASADLFAKEGAYVYAADLDVPRSRRVTPISAGSSWMSPRTPNGPR